MKSKLSLDQLKVKSFVTGLDSKKTGTAKGGDTCFCTPQTFIGICASHRECPLD